METFNEQSFVAYLTQQTHSVRKDIIVGIGDDSAVLAVPAGQQLTLCTDTLVKGVHFPEKTDAYDIGYKAAIVNLSDCAAMCATPAFALCSLTVPEAKTDWLTPFTTGLLDALNQYDCALVGGDLTHGPLSVTVTLGGYVLPKQLKLRAHAKVGDAIFVTGALGWAAAGLASLAQRMVLPLEEATRAISALNLPTARVKEAKALQPYIHALMDISDGLAADLPRLLTASGQGAKIYLNQCPGPNAIRHQLTGSDWIKLILNGGDDYELLGTASPDNIVAMQAALAELNCPLTVIGEVTEGKDIIYCDKTGAPVECDFEGYQHF